MRSTTNKLVLVGIAGLLCVGTTYAGGDEDPCVETADVLKRACGFDIRDDYFEALAVCENLATEEQEEECEREAQIERFGAREECGDVYERRLDLCDALGGGAYDPPFGEDFANNFVDPREIGQSVPVNPWFPLVQGNEWIYEVSEDGEVTETIVVIVTNDTKLIEGITCLTVTDLVFDEDGELIEDTDDWYAQDLDGNVWYCGEIAQNFERFEGDDPDTAELVDTEGSWKSGRDGARAGILLPFAAAVGDVIRQEVSWSEAEDAIEILSVTGTESAPAGECKGSCLVTRDFTPLDEGEANKYYAPGLGLIVEIEGDERVDLVEVITAP